MMTCRRSGSPTFSANVVVFDSDLVVAEGDGATAGAEPDLPGFFNFRLAVGVRVLRPVRGLAEIQRATVPIDDIQIKTAAVWNYLQRLVPHLDLYRQK